jgi:CxxC motif-containing protein (DUF1111 family)
MKRVLLAAAVASIVGLAVETARATGGTAGTDSSPHPYEGLSPVATDLFAAGLAQFRARETPAAGLGPVFNAESCEHCHAEPAAGGSSAAFVTRFGRALSRGFDPMTERGGPVIQARGIVTDDCATAGEVVPPEATVIARRDTPPLFGLGLIDTIPDRRILRLADPEDRNDDGISGRVNQVRGRVGRFGWKAQAATLRQFVATAYLNEIGMTSPDVPDELSPQGGPVVCDGARDPEDDGGRIDRVTGFLVLLAPLRRTPPRPALGAGRLVFRRAGCDTCHTTRLRAGRTHAVRALHGRRVPMFSDLLLHDMGPALADGIAQGFASPSEFRTAPLWGVRESAPYLHDGRAATLEEAIARHGGEADAARERFLALPAEKKALLITFLGSI